MHTQQKHKTRVRIDAPDQARELTFSTNAQRPLFADAALAELFVRTLAHTSERHRFQLLAFVVMHDHVHLLGVPAQDENQVASVSTFLMSLKRMVSYRAKVLLQEKDPDLVRSLMHEERRNKRVYRFWLPGGGYDRNLVYTKSIRASIEYIHANPVRAGLAASPEAYPWSSAGQWRTPGQELPEWMPRVASSLAL